MEFELKNKNLITLYTTGQCKKLKFLDAKAIDNFFDCMQNIEAAESIHDWQKLPGLKFEKLQGYKKRFSMRIDGKHRLEFDIDFEDEEKTKGFVNVLEISKHYK